ncbi:hypothetical protein CFC21_072273 [Triticum aestivum]|uniref:Transmembrane protein n=3 Tax=Triticum TaxID=4564 RepID=A0A9R0WZ05_TRITD|nr:uncharacterized protein LOC123115547 [Triticum aestivum]KAF7066256.1 hypothetical protein CFC21_072273 [Triticum aestivum]VAI26944.1 unnamed protein product [Triticum turgidum subsp. durum]
MDAPQKKARSMDKDGKMPPLPLTVGKKKTASPCPDTVRLVSQWTLSTACFFLVVFAVTQTLDHYHVPVPCSPSSLVLRCVELTDAGAVEAANAAAESAGWIGMLWCGTAQAAAAALALHLPCRYRRVRRALAYLALALAIVGHSLYARATVLLYAADPGSLFAVIGWTLIIAFLAVVDLLCFLVLVMGREA